MLAEHGRIFEGRYLSRLDLEMYKRALAGMNVSSRFPFPPKMDSSVSLKSAPSASHLLSTRVAAQVKTKSITKPSKRGGQLLPRTRPSPVDGPDSTDDPIVDADQSSDLGDDPVKTDSGGTNDEPIDLEKQLGTLRFQSYVVIF